jgi:hypothetical protein
MSSTVARLMTYVFTIRQKQQPIFRQSLLVAIHLPGRTVRCFMVTRLLVRLGHFKICQGPCRAHFVPVARIQSRVAPSQFLHASLAPAATTVPPTPPLGPASTAGAATFAPSALAPRRPAPSKCPRLAAGARCKCRGRPSSSRQRAARINATGTRRQVTEC